MRRSRRTVNVKDLARRISKNLLQVGEDFLDLGRAIQSGMASRIAGPQRGAAASRGGRGGRRRTRRALTPRDRARLRQQGEYLGLVRHLSERDRTRVKSLRSRKGYPDAIRMARRLLKSRG